MGLNSFLVNVKDFGSAGLKVNANEAMCGACELPPVRGTEEQRFEAGRMGLHLPTPPMKFAPRPNLLHAPCEADPVAVVSCRSGNGTVLAGFVFFGNCLLELV